MLGAVTPRKALMPLTRAAAHGEHYRGVVLPHFIDAYGAMSSCYQAAVGGVPGQQILCFYTIGCGQFRAYTMLYRWCEAEG